MTSRAMRAAGSIGVAVLTSLSVLTPATAAGGVQTSPPSWGLDRVDQRSGLDQTYRYETTAANVTAYVIDTGVDKAHPDFGGRVEPGRDLVGTTDGTIDGNGNGTHLAGVLGGSRYGLAKQVRIVPVRVLDDSGAGSVANVVAGVDWVREHARQPAVAVLGVGGGPNETLDAAVKRLTAVMPVAVPAGAEATDAGGFSPGRVTEALTVAASNSMDQVSRSSNFGPAVDLYAPGVEVPAPSKGGPGAGVVSGTTIAAGFVAGAAALYRGLHPSATPAAVSKALVDAATTGALKNVPQNTRNRLLYTLSVPAAGKPAESPAQ